jgi:hypothetical protein
LTNPAAESHKVVLLNTASHAFVTGFQLAAAISALLMVATTALILTCSKSGDAAAG